MSESSDTSPKAEESLEELTEERNPLSESEAIACVADKSNRPDGQHEEDSAVCERAESVGEAPTLCTAASSMDSPASNVDLAMASASSASSGALDSKSPDFLTWSQIANDASKGWQKFALAKSILVALWSPAVLMTNTTMSRWLPAMAMSHTLLVLALAWHAYMRLLQLHAPGSRVIALANRTQRKHPPPFGAWLRLLWACTLAAIVLGTHIGAMTSHYDRKKCLKSVQCWRAWILTLGFCVGSISLAIQYVYAEWIFFRTGVRISHFLYTPTAFLVDEGCERRQQKEHVGKNE
eukprot:TRINITY_DN47268_c0_g1_i1.p1 TRINITY_DN47268_c0_g1~~TRINITY_DN47268_c0_g1_i1.p1  ORF type:complete len:294 (+),score=38.99 TRINITY_DN47268_c0_g1_i1:37-918(+)